MGDYRKRSLRYPLFALIIFSILIVIALSMWHISLAIICAVGLSIVIFYLFKIERDTYIDTEKHIEALSYRVENVGEEVLLELPIGIILIGEDYRIEWANPYMLKILHRDALVGEELSMLSEDLLAMVQTKEDEMFELTLPLHDRKYNVMYKSHEHLLYFFDVTERVAYEKKYYADRTVIGILLIDNYDDLTQPMDDQKRGLTNTLITSIINSWAAEHDIFVKRISSDRFIAVLNERILHRLEQKKFAVLDTIRERTAKKSLSLTLSIGIGEGSTSLMELGILAQSGLDLALGRGGDQVAIKRPSGKLRFYGGKTNPIEKRTRVRARVISHALRDLIQESDQVFIMGHANPDMDSIGASIGVRKMAEKNNIEGFIVLDFDELNGSVSRLMDEIEHKSSFYDSFLAPEAVLERMTDQSLVIVVDTHKPSMVIDPRIVKQAEKVVVIDHHRRSEDFIENPVLVYMEPYASSTAELVTELLEYQPANHPLNMLEATALLAGIIVDTKSFTLRTGSRTFDAASYLRAKGADTILVQRFLKEDVDTYIERSKIVQSVEFYRPGIAIATGEEQRVYNSVLIAQTADILLTMKDVSASFVIAHRADGMIGISARSLSDINVQLVMERLGGGGHLTNAACQMNVGSIKEAKERLKQAISDVVEGSIEQ
ncbi:cyclic-di-AMP phosphodiesterase GdpP [Lysinibacillus alkalisoli]|uniref:Cyclic-di-AMP phosphodiesterase n=1 Tax=Lysinibacillus alkalisoli TaxID=1911548 RepID=A0A917G8W6_9BACI|nr:DHH family phosphoesterase [Lysinibacillus alkalisoli]GGG28439.1 cyclic-di-AMP phosphodiesterase GdpP [Lysinibacillus alkalisoli]